MDLGRFGRAPTSASIQAAAKGFQQTYTAYYVLLVKRDSTTIRNTYIGSFVSDLDGADPPGKTYLDTIADGNYRMPQRGSVTVKSVSPVVGLPGEYAVQFCRSPRTQPYDSSRRQYVDLPVGRVQTGGFPDAVTVIRTGGSWYLINAQGSGQKNLCSGTRYRS